MEKPEYIIEVNHVSKQFEDGKFALDDVSLQIKKGEFVTILGPSGCGKTTLLRCIAGFQVASEGDILLKGEDITQTPPHKRPVNTVFQKYALFPHLNVYDNVAFGLKLKKLDADTIMKRVRQALKTVGMSDYEFRDVDSLSGGQQQRVAIARAIVNQPEVLLLDEPLAALDLKMRKDMQLELKEMHKKLGITFIYVTHDQGEAMSISDRIAVMNNGHIEQIGTPAEIYEAPRSSFVAAFIGDTNFFDGRITKVIDTEYCILNVPDLPPILCFNDKKLALGANVHLSIRPEKFQISLERPQVSDKYNVLEGTVEDVVYQGDHTKYWVTIADDWKIALTRQHTRFMLDEKPITWNDHVFVYWFADDGFMLDRYSAADEDLLQVPPQTVGETEISDATNADLPNATMMNLEKEIEK